MLATNRSAEKNPQMQIRLLFRYLRVQVQGASVR